MNAVNTMGGGTGVSVGYTLPYMTASAAELAGSPQQLWGTQGTWINDEGVEFDKILISSK